MYDFKLRQEEFDMTLQVALVGKDGFVLASDRKTSSGGLVPGGKPHIRRTGDARKILISKSGTVSCAIYGNQMMSSFAGRLLNSLDGHADWNTEDRLLDESDKIFRQYDTSLFASGVGLILVFTEAKTDTSRLWDIQFWGMPTINQPSPNHAIAGDRSNEAVYLIERYYADGQERLVEELKVLAAHTIFEGGALNPSVVGGLDILICRDGERPKFLEEAELQSLRDRSDSLHQMLSAEIFRL